MPTSEVEEFLALGLVFVVHVIGGLLLVWGIIDDEGRGNWRRWWRRGDGPEDPPRDPGPTPTRAVRLPLPDAAQGRVRLREDGRASDAYPRPSRRPEHPPAPGRPVPTRRQSH